MEVELKVGYTDKDGNLHKNVTFGKRPKVSDLILLDMNPQTQNPTQYQQLLRRLMITGFGTLKMPVPLTVLLALDTVDDDILLKGADDYLQTTRNEREGKMLENGEAQLRFGIEIDGVVYNIVKFGNRLTVGDNAEADSLGLGNGIAKKCFQIGKQISEIRNSETGLKFEGSLSPDEMSDVDGEDFNILLFAAEFFRLSIHRTRKNVSRKSGSYNTSDSKGNGVE